MHDFDSLTSVDSDFFPEPLEGPRFEALKANIEQHGQHQAILATEDGDYYNGRAIVETLRQLNRPVLVRRVDADTARAAALGSLIHRHPTVLDQVRLVAWVKATYFKGRAKKGQGKHRELIAQWLRTNLGWHQDASPRQVGNLLRIAAMFPELSPQQKQFVRGAPSVSEALKELRPINRLVKTPGERALAAVKRFGNALRAAAGDPQYFEALHDAELLMAELKKKASAA